MTSLDPGRESEGATAPPRTITRGLGSVANSIAIGGPHTLAALRVATGLGVLWYAARTVGFRLPPEALRFPPPGTDWIPLPASQLVFDVALVILVVSAVTLTLGWRSLVSASLASVAMLHVGWATTLTGKVDHQHHLLWVLVLLAASPCANTWAVRPEHRRGSHRLPVTAAMLLIGLTYFGAGLQKITDVGVSWAWSDNVRHLATEHAWRHGREPLQLLAQSPVASRLAGSAALLFELGFLPMLFFPRIRRRAWPVGLAFHWGTWLTLSIPFVSLQLMYVIFLPWDRDATQRALAGASDVPSGNAATAAQRSLAAGLVGSVTIMALSGMSLAWPVAAYPGFATIADGRLTTYSVQTETGRVPLEEVEVVKAVMARRAITMIRAAREAGRLAELEEWLGGRLWRSVVDTHSGEIVVDGPLPP